MLKPINISPLNTSNEIEYNCDSCSKTGVFIATNIINVDNLGRLIEDLDFSCPFCGNIINK
jgi:predicted RNA-binding Zn-ribbon protein involved in translation (DUF1610 family)